MQLTAVSECKLTFSTLPIDAVENKKRQALLLVVVVMVLLLSLLPPPPLLINPDPLFDKGAFVTGGDPATIAPVGRHNTAVGL
jgi:hypothetical protein